MKNLILSVVLLIVPTVTYAADSLPDRAHWALEIKGGSFKPDIEGWSDFYEKTGTSQYGGSLAYKVLRQFEVGIEGMYSKDTGQGYAPLHAEAAGTVNFETSSLNVFVLARAQFTEEQLLVPYVGGGWTRIFYRGEVQDQSVARGSVDGVHARAGIQLLLDNLDPSAAINMYTDYGVNATYFFIETEYTRAMIDSADSPSVSINLGGTSWLAGLLFEF